MVWEVVVSLWKIVLSTFGNSPRFRNIFFFNERFNGRLMLISGYLGPPYEKNSYLGVLLLFWIPRSQRKPKLGIFMNFPMMPGSISLWSHWRWSSLAATSQVGRWESLMQPFLEKNRDRDTLIETGSWVGSWNIFESGRKWSWCNDRYKIDMVVICGDVLVEQMMLIKIWMCFKSYQFGSSAGEMTTISGSMGFLSPARIEETSFPSSLPKRSFSAKLLGL